MNQYSLGDEPGRKELLDALLNYLEREGREGEGRAYQLMPVIG